jgi:hypothetical protein
MEFFPPTWLTTFLLKVLNILSFIFRVTRPDLGFRNWHPKLGFELIGVHIIHPLLPLLIFSFSLFSIVDHDNLIMQDPLREIFSLISGMSVSEMGSESSSYIP